MNKFKLWFLRIILPLGFLIALPLWVALACYLSRGMNKTVEDSLNQDIELLYPFMKRVKGCLP